MLDVKTQTTHLDSSNSKCVFQVGSQSEGDFFRNTQTSAFLETDVVVDMNNLENTTTESKLDLYMNIYNLQLDWPCCCIKYTNSNTSSIRRLNQSLYVNQGKSVSHIQTLSRSRLLLCFLHGLVMCFTRTTPAGQTDQVN